MQVAFLLRSLMSPYQLPFVALPDEIISCCEDNTRLGMYKVSSIDIFLLRHASYDDEQ